MLPVKVVPLDSAGQLPIHVVCAMFANKAEGDNWRFANNAVWYLICHISAERMGVAVIFRVAHQLDIVCASPIELDSLSPQLQHKTSQHRKRRNVEGA